MMTTTLTTTMLISSSRSSRFLDNVIQGGRRNVWPPSRSSSADTVERRGKEGGGSAYRKPSRDQCRGAFIVLQQKGAHQSTGISSRLISRGRGETHRPVLPQPGPLHLFLQLLPQTSFHRLCKTLFPLAPSHFLLSVTSHSLRRTLGGDSGYGAATAAAATVVMKTYEIYSIWADAITLCAPSMDLRFCTFHSHPLASDEFTSLLNFSLQFFLFLVLTISFELVQDQKWLVSNQR